MLVGHNWFEKIISLENLFSSWQEFRRGKRQKLDVQFFEWRLEDNLFRLNFELENGFYRHGSYQSFRISDPKPRLIHKATVRDRVVHHAVCRILYPLFDKNFIFDSYSCRLDKGTHRAVDRLALFLDNVSRHNRQTVFAAKCDIKKFFASVDHEILEKLLRRRIADVKVEKLLGNIISSFSAEPKPVGGGGDLEACRLAT
jgi:retron-type reverse transcriptase